MKFISYDGLDEVFDISSTEGGCWIPTEGDGLPSAGELNAFYGKKHTEETKALMKESAKKRGKSYTNKQRRANAKKTYLFISPQNTIVMIRGSLNFFCQQRGLNNGAMAALHRGAGMRNSQQHKGWRKYG